MQCWMTRNHWESRWSVYGSPIITTNAFARVSITFSLWNILWKKGETQQMNRFQTRKITSALTFESCTNPSDPFERTVEMMITGLSFPWKVSAVPTRTSLKWNRHNCRAIRRRCLRYGVTIPISVWVIYFKPNSTDSGGSNILTVRITSSISSSLYQLSSNDRWQSPSTDLKIIGNEYQLTSSENRNESGLVFSNFSNELRKMRLRVQCSPSRAIGCNAFP